MTKSESERYLSNIQGKFETEKDFALFIKEWGGTLYRVGGSVRDEIMFGESYGDRDYAVEGLESLPFKLVGLDFPVYLVEIGSEGGTCEVALCRTERKTGKGYNGFEVSTKDVTIQQDLMRRDLTINAMAINVLTGDLIDPFGGFGHARFGLLTHTSDAFAEDPLRILRVARFAARFPRFGIDVGTIALMENIVHELEAIPGERIAKELFKVFEQTHYIDGDPSRFFDVLDDVGALEIVFPEIHALHVPDKHDGTTYNHVMMLLKYAETLDEFLGLLAHDLGKGLTDPEQHPSHFGHDKLGVEAAQSMAKRLRLSKTHTRIMVAASLTHMNLKMFKEMRIAKQLRMVIQYNDILETLLNVTEVDSLMRGGLTTWDQLQTRVDFVSTRMQIERIRTVVSLVNGNTLISEGVVPDQNFGAKLEQRRISALKKVLRDREQI